MFAGRFFRNEQGSAATEMALLLPLSILLLFGSVEAGYFFYTQHKVVKGVREGARYASRQNFGYYICGNTALQDPTGLPTGSTVTSAIKNVTRTGFPGGGTPRVVGWIDSEVTVTVSCPPTGQEVTGGIYNGKTNAPQVNVSAVVDYPSLFGVLTPLDSTFRLRAKQQSAVMGI